MGRLRGESFVGGVHETYVTTMQRNQLELLDSAQLCYNLLKSLATKASPFELVLGAQPQTLVEIVIQRFGVKSPTTCKFAKERLELFEQVDDNLRKVSKRMQKYVGLKRRPLEFDKGDKVMFKLTLQIQKKIIGQNRDRGLHLG